MEAPPPATPTPTPTPAPSLGHAKRMSGIRRPRPSYRCDNCRSRRVKCDQAHPVCSNCARYGVDCVYERTAVKRKDPPRKDSTTRSMRRRVEGDETQSNHGYLLIQNGGRSRYIENTFWASVDVEGLDLDSLLFDLPLFPLEDTCCSAGHHGNIDDSHGPCPHYVGTTEPNYSYWASRRPHTMRSGGHSLASTLSQLPARTVCDTFYKSFIDTIHPLIPLLHIPTFDLRYRRFWEWYKTWTPDHPPEDVLAENPGFLPLLVTVLFAGSITQSASDEVATLCPLLKTQKLLHHLIPVALALVGFPHNPSVYSLMAFLLLNSMLIREEESLSSCSFVAVAFRICQAMGLHKDGKDFGLDDIQVEERRRIWCHLMHLDVMTSIVSGLPLVASTEMFSNTRPIRELRDECIGNGQEDDAETGPTVDLNYILNAGRYDATSYIRIILLRQFSPKPLTPGCLRDIEEGIEKLKSRMEKRIERLALQSRQEYGSLQTSTLSSSESSSELSEETNSRVRWGTDLLHLMIEKAYCLLYQPMMRDSDIWKEIRPKAIPRFQSFLSIFIDMCTAEAYLPYHWLYPGAYQPLQPVAVLLIDLLRNSQSEESAKSRALLEKTFSLLGPNGRVTNVSLGMNGWPDGRHVSAGAKQAWMRLERLRAKVWQKLGLDHNVLWMRSINNAGVGGLNSQGNPGPYNNDIATNSTDPPGMGPLNISPQNTPGFIDSQVNFLPVEYNNNSVQAFDNTWDTLALPPELASIIPPFEDMDYFQ